MAIIKSAVSVSSEINQRQHGRDFAALLLELESSDPSARRWAARDLAEFSASAPALVARLKHEKDASVSEAILTTLTKLADPVAISCLVGCLRSENVSLRNGVIEAMKNLPQEVAPIMGRLLHDPDADVRIFAVNILESLAHPQVEAWLVDVITHDAHINVCATALDLLGEVGSYASLNALQNLQLKFADEPYFQFAVDLALKRIREARDK